MRAPNFPLHALKTATAVVGRFAARVSEVHERRHIVHGLAGLDDHMLRDIGLNRCDVDSVLVQPALTDGTLLLAERVRDSRRHQGAVTQEAQDWTALMPKAGTRLA
jgi:uncharacterized protein YjiS (DUF1127 family)